MELKLVISALLLALGISLSACAPSTGRRFEIGISPVKQLNNQAGLSQEDAPQQVKGGKY